MRAGADRSFHLALMPCRALVKQHSSPSCSFGGIETSDVTGITLAVTTRKFWASR